MLEIFRSSSVARLCEKYLHERSLDVTGDPFQPDWVLVPNMDMARWLGVQTAAVEGITANVTYKLPVQLVKELISSLETESRKHISMDKSVLSWLIFEAFDELLNQNEFTRIKAYIEQRETKTWRRWQLARETADVMEQYILYRPDWLQDWELGKISKELADDADAAWQMCIWQYLRSKYPDITSLTSGMYQLEKTLHEHHPNPEMAKLDIFLPGAMPPIVTRMLCLLARHIPVRWYQHELPEIAHDTLQTYLNEQEAQKKLLETSADEAGISWKTTIIPEESEDFRTLSPVLSNTTRSEISTCEIAPIQIHSCHNRRREVEVLKDYLLRLFSETNISPGEVVVVTPNPAAYEGYVHSIFGQPEQEQEAIPYSFPYSVKAGQGQISETFLNILKMGESRYKASEVMAFLEIPALRERYQLSDRDLEKLQHWAKETHIRWGIDGNHKSRFDVPPYDGNTWKMARNRLILGTMMAEEHDFPLEMLPFDDIGGTEDKELLGKWLTINQHFFDVANVSKQEYERHTWAEILLEKVQALFSEVGEYREGVWELQAALRKLCDISEQTVRSEHIPLRCIISWLRMELDKSGSGRSFTNGVVTFGAMVPLRHIPCSVVCMLGMNDGEIPVRQNQSAFDVMSRYERAGDRNRRDTDRLLFLQYLMGAKEFVFLSYMGQNPRTNEEIQAATVLTDLRNVLHAHKERTHPDFYKEYQHPIQPFSPRYFSESEYGTYSTLAQEAMIRFQHPSRKSKSFFADLEDYVPETLLLDPSQVIRFWRDPHQYILRKEFSIQLDEQEFLDKDNELDGPDYLEAFVMKHQLLQAFIRGDDVASTCRKIAMQGILPPGRKGNLLLELYRQEMAQMADLAGLTGMGQPAHHRISEEFWVDGKQIVLQGVLPMYHGDTIVDIRPSAHKDKDTVPAWFRYLVLACSVNKELNYRLIRQKNGKIQEFRCVVPEQPRENLQRVLSYFLRAHRYHFPFFPKALRVCAESLMRGEDEKVALSQAEVTLYDTNAHRYSTSEMDSPWVRYAYRDSEIVLGDEFLDLCKDVMMPALTHIQEVK